MSPSERGQRRSANIGASVRVVIGGHYPVVNVGLEQMLKSGEVTVAAVTTSPDELVRIAKPEWVAVALIDVHSGADWMTILPELKAANPAIAIIAVTGHEGAALYSQPLRLACSGILSMRATQDDFLGAVRSAVRGYGLVETGWLAGMLAGRDTPHSQITVLEQDVLSCLAEGLSNPQMASRLKCSVSTVKNYLHTIFEKLEVSDRTQAVAKAFKMGIIALLDGPADRS